MFGEKTQKPVVRIAPSPTGHLHIGTARTALFNYLFARRYGGSFILRSEDTDTTRSTAAYEEEILAGLTWLGIEWDAFYRQSERTEYYQKYLTQMIEAGSAYISKEESKRDPGTEIEVIRLRNPNTTIAFEDAIREEVTFDTTDLGDFVIARSMTEPLYHLSVVVDDHEMEVTHVIRGEDHISNTPRQILIQEAIGAARPSYAHLPLLLAPDRSKLSKRHGAVALEEYKSRGFLPEAIVNHLAMLGWNPGTDQEVFTLPALVKEFDLGGIQKGGAIFTEEKLRWFNKEHLAKMEPAQRNAYLLSWLIPIVSELPQFSHERAARLLPVISERASVGEDVRKAAMEGEYDFAFAAPKPAPEMLMWKNDHSPKDALPRLRRTAEILSTLAEEADIEAIKNPLFSYAETAGKGEVLWPLRVALTGRERSPDPFTVIHIVGTAEAYQRVTRACDTILSA